MPTGKTYADCRGANPVIDYAKLMCGIAGIYQRRATDGSEPLRVAVMTGMLVHRGPDDFGYLFLDSRSGEFKLTQDVIEDRRYDVCLGHRRLSIVDLSPQGRQPMSNETGDLFLTFNGEIFNYLELRSELIARGYRFRTQTDSEVVLNAYAEWGEECVSRFNGMWAFAIWDQRRREMFCSRDRFGIKPFYYHLEAGRFCFASEIKGILPALDSVPAVDYGPVCDYLVDASLCQTDATFFDGISRLPPAHNLVVSGSAVRLSRYWDFQPRIPSRDPVEAVETFRDLLTDAVRLRLRGDVPVGVALSGGIDSTSILCLAAKSSSKPPKAFTAVFPGEPYDEHQYARIACQATGSELLTVDYQPRDFLDALSKIIWSLDYPALEPQVLPRRELMQLAGRHATVILEGQGADEMLAGYVYRYFALGFIGEFRKFKIVEALSTVRQAYAGYGRMPWVTLLHQVVPSPHLYRSRRLLSTSVRGVYTREFIRANPPQEERQKTPFEDRLTRQLQFDFSVGMLPMLLKLGDALSMASSVESRLPYLDHRLVEFVFGLPPHQKLRGTQSKVILRQAMEGVIPEQVRRRADKIGFYTPFERWIAGSMDKGIRPLLLSKGCSERGIFHPGRIRKILEWQTSGNIHAELAIFRWVSLELWFRVFIDDVSATAKRLAGSESIRRA